MFELLERFVCICFLFVLSAIIKRRIREGFSREIKEEGERAEWRSQWGGGGGVRGGEPEGKEAHH